MKSTNQLFLKPVEFAVAIGASKQSVYSGIQRGEIPFCRIAGLLRIPRAALDKYTAEAMASTSSESAESD
jgi:excisionase family DNA binding protein